MIETGCRDAAGRRGQDDAGRAAPRSHRGRRHRRRRERDRVRPADWLAVPVHRPRWRTQATWRASRLSMDRVMGRIGLHGKSFVPMLSGFSCAVPAVLATRTLESRTDRLLTMMVLPLVSCSARLPVYVLVIATVFGGAGASSASSVRGPGAVRHVPAVGDSGADRGRGAAAHGASGARARRCCSNCRRTAGPVARVLLRSDVAAGAVVPRGRGHGHPGADDRSLGAL